VQRRRGRAFVVAAGTGEHDQRARDAEPGSRRVPVSDSDVDAGGAITVTRSGATPRDRYLSVSRAR
jgi:hypothetical protein